MNHFETISVTCACQFRDSGLVHDCLHAVQLQTSVVTLQPARWAKPILHAEWSAETRSHLTYTIGYDDWIVWSGACPQCGKEHRKESHVVRTMLSIPERRSHFRMAELDELSKTEPTNDPH